MSKNDQQILTLFFNGVVPISALTTKIAVTALEFGVMLLVEVVVIEALDTQMPISRT